MSENGVAVNVGFAPMKSVCSHMACIRDLAAGIPV